LYFDVLRFVYLIEGLGFDVVFIGTLY